MEIIIQNCNNIDSGNIQLSLNELNIKYAINGTGKSTISKAIISSINDKTSGAKDIQKLKPFKHLNTADNNPSITGIDNFNSVKIFDEEYTSKYLFLPDDLLQGSFDIFIRDAEYENGMNEINELIKIIQDMFVQDKDIDGLINDFNELSSSFGKPVKNGIHGSSNISKAFKGGNKITNIPKEVEEYKEYIQSDNNIKWIKWIIDGKIYLDASDNCPYCISNISKKKDKIIKVSNIYEPKVIEYINKIVSVFSRLNKYFSENTKNIVDSFINSVDGYTDEQVRFLLEIKEQIDNMNKKFCDAKYLSFKSMKDVDKVIEYLKNQRIDTTYYSHLQSNETKQKADIVNNSIDQILEKAGILQGKINLQKKHIEKVIKENKEEINNFLRNAGYNYHVDLIEDDKKQYSLKLIHNDINDSLKDVKNHLSFGERNAFSIVLFMYDALKVKPDLIILDDPISSFDKNKKYAIIDMLFRKEKSFKGKTVLMLTHDFEPIIDMVYHHRDRFKIPKAYFLENNHGVLSEKEVLRENIVTFIDICDLNISRNVNEVTKLVYLRRKYEILDEKGVAYNLISNLLHKRETPVITENEKERDMTEEEINIGNSEVIEKIPEFDYNRILSNIKNDEYLLNLYHQTTCNYEKLHIYRVLFDDKVDQIESSIVNKFINQAFHIENEYIYQLNPIEYQLVPQYVIDECDLQISELMKSNMVLQS